MERKFGYYILFGLILGTILGVFWERATDDMTLFILFGAFGGVFMGWFVATIIKNQKNQKNGV